MLHHWNYLWKINSDANPHRYIERWTKQHGKRFDYEERKRKRLAREGHKQSQDAQKLHGLRAKLYQKKRHAEKIQMKKQIKAQEERNVKSAAPSEPSSTPLPQYLLDRTQTTNAKALSSAIKNKRAEKAAKFSVPLPKVRGIAEEEMFKVVKTGKKTAKKGWKRMITKPTFGTYSRAVVSRPWSEDDKWRVVLMCLTSGQRIYSKTGQVRALHSTYGTTIQESQRHASGARGYSSVTYHIGQEEPSESHVHSAGSTNQGYDNRGQRQRVRIGHGWWEGCLG